MYSSQIKTIKMWQPIKKISVYQNVIHYELVHNVRIVRAKSSVWSDVKMGPPDAILGISEAYKRDQDPNKINLGVGAYRDDKGKPFILPSVKIAEDIIHSKHFNHEYAPISGNASFCRNTASLVFGGNHKIIKKKSVCTVQTLSGTGALRMGFEFIQKFFPCNKVMYLPSPTWGNHIQLCKRLKLRHEMYRYYNPKTHGFDIQGALEDICAIPKGSIILLHACAHNPTGVDPKPEEWQQISALIRRRKLLPFFDMAYQGFATGNIDNDAYAPRLFASEGHYIILAQSFAKNMGLYGERVGALHIVCESPETAAKVLSQMKILIRVAYSNPPLYGSRIVNTILSTPHIRSKWLGDVKEMSERIKLMRLKLQEGLNSVGSTRDWQHVVNQIGMFCYTGLNTDEVARLKKQFHIYLTKDGRISIAGINSKNVEYLAESMHKVTSKKSSSSPPSSPCKGCGCGCPEKKQL